MAPEEKKVRQFVLKAKLVGLKKIRALTYVTIKWEHSGESARYTLPEFRKKFGVSASTLIDGSEVSITTCI